MYLFTGLAGAAGTSTGSTSFQPNPLPSLTHQNAANLNPFENSVLLLCNTASLGNPFHWELCLL